MKTILALWHSIGNLCNIKEFRRAITPKFYKPLYTTVVQHPHSISCNGYTKPCEKALIVGKVAPLF